MRKLLTLSLLVALSASCSDTTSTSDREPTNSIDAGSDLPGPLPDFATPEMSTLDSGTDRPDMQVALDIAPELDISEDLDSGEEEDAGEEPDLDADFDAGPDASPDLDESPDLSTEDPFEGRPVGQCTVDSDCPANPNGATCNRRLPGGSCGSCGDDSACDDECLVGTCITTCGGDDDCPPGLRCTGTGRCAAARCSAGVCPIPLFGCSSSDLCERVDCSSGQACPGGTTCLAGLCIEDRSMRP